MLAVGVFSPQLQRKLQTNISTVSLSRSLFPSAAAFISSEQNTAKYFVSKRANLHTVLEVMEQKARRAHTQTVTEMNY